MRASLRSWQDSSCCSGLVFSWMSGADLGCRGCVKGTMLLTLANLQLLWLWSRPWCTLGVSAFGSQSDLRIPEWGSLGARLSELNQIRLFNETSKQMGHCQSSAAPIYLHIPGEPRSQGSLLGYRAAKEPRNLPKHGSVMAHIKRNPGKGLQSFKTALIRYLAGSWVAAMYRYE